MAYDNAGGQRPLGGVTPESALAAAAWPTRRRADRSVESDKVAHGLRLPVLTPPSRRPKAGSNEPWRQNESTHRPQAATLNPITRARNPNPFGGLIHGILMGEPPIPTIASLPQYLYSTLPFTTRVIAAHTSRNAGWPNAGCLHWPPQGRVLSGTPVPGREPNANFAGVTARTGP